MKSILYHNPDNLSLEVPAGEKHQVLLVFDATIDERVVRVRIQDHANADLLVWIILSKARRISLTIRIEHTGAGSISSARVKAILRGTSRNTFTGDVVIPRGVKDVESFLEYRALLFDEARATATPALEIEEHPIRAGHAAAIGRINDQQLFYLQSRGFNTEEATRLIAQGFFAELVKTIADSKQKKEVARLLNRCSLVV